MTPPLSALVRPRFIRFLLVGFFNTAFSYGVYALFLWLGLNYAIATLLALVFGILVSFKTQGTIVFGMPGSRPLGRFVLCWAMIYFFNIALIRVFLMFGFDAYIAGFLALPLVAGISYALLTRVVFRGSEASSSRALETQTVSTTNSSVRAK